MTSLLSARTLPDRRGGLVRWGGLTGASRALAVAEAAADADGAVLCVTASAKDAEAFERELAFFGEGGPPLMHFPDWETLPYDSFSPHQDIVSERLATLAALPRLERGIVVVPAATLLQRLPPADYVRARAIALERGQRLDREDFVAGLVAAGYVRVSQVMEHGDIAVRGSLIDLFPMGRDKPVRIDFFDEEIESLREFDPDTQLSLEEIESLSVLPARETPLDEQAVREFRRRYRARFAGEAARSRVYREVSEGIAHGGIEYYLPLFFDTTAGLLDYLPAGTLAFRPPDLEALLAGAWREIEERHGIASLDPERPVLDPEEAFLPAASVADSLSAYRSVELSANKPPPGGPDSDRDFATRPVPPLRIDTHREDAAARLAAFVQQFEGRVLFCADSAGRREAIVDLLSARGIAVPRVADWPAFVAGDAPTAVAVAPLEEGALLPAAGLALVAEHSIFGRRISQRRRRRRRGERDPEAVIRELGDLREGAPVVHEEYGVGRYRGLQTLDAGGVLNEYLTLEYAGGDKVYVPVHALHLISRYTGASAESAPLHRLGSDQWARARRRAAERVRDVAAELLDVYARRAARTGHAFHADEADYRAFAAGFPFEPTEDQRQVIEEVREDLRKPSPMDRLVCGDVGFGKTEVALRAAFVAVSDGKQVAVLVPTTLLAQQHYQTFSDRFADWPVVVEVLSRFRSRRETEEVLAGLADGRVDIVIGTHKLLQHRNSLKDVGLIVIDEEHRFGVRHKESLKSLRAEVDVLTLTATPIPRTLNMALGGLRDLSLIATPPPDRLSVKTFVTQWNDAMIREACLREIKRGGQVYFVHNRVEDIERQAARLRKLVPEAELRIGHGQMSERELEEVMLDFYHRRFNLLVCTTIIESGIDVASANTIVINRADRYGLAQLHQLRGRVGRSHHRAYAYLIAPPESVMTADAIKRLEAIDALEDLGAGFALASHDLEIRGAGELLGDEQSGQIQEIGFTLYTELLGRAVEALKNGEEPELERPLEAGVEINLHAPALLPEDYVPDVHLRLVLYKRISGAQSEQEIGDLHAQLVDRFGLLPGPARLFMRIARLKLAAERLGIVKIDAGARGGYVVFGENASVDPMALVRLVQSDGERYRLRDAERLSFEAELATVDERVAFVDDLLTGLARSTAMPAMAS